MALLTGGAQAAMGAVFWYVGSRGHANGIPASHVIASVLFTLAAAFLLTSLLAPAAAVALYRRWTAGAHAVGVAFTIVLFALVFVGVLPFFLFVRRRDPLRKRLGAASYWEPAPPDDPSLERALRQY
jgi:drug/metabolite transporter (DMT)-like permease